MLRLPVGLKELGSNVQPITEELLEANKVSSIGSDCHNLKSRTPDLLAGLKQAKKLLI